MAQVITVDDLIADIRVMSGLRNNQLFSNDQIQQMVIDAGDELYDDVEGTFEHYFIDTFDFTIAAGESAVDLPESFKRDNSLTRNPDTSTPETVDVLGSWLERNDQSSSIWTPSARRYFITGDQLEIFPTAAAPGNYRLFFTPQFEFVSPGVATAGVQLATVAALPTCTSSPPGPGHSLTATSDGALTVDGVAVNDDDPILVLNQENDLDNGVYVATVAGDLTHPFILTRPTPFTYSTGMVLSVSAGDVNARQSFQLVSSPIDVDVLPLVFELVQLTLPRAMRPWALYLKVHTSIAIRTSRQQDTTDLQAKLQALKTRVSKSAKNRTEAPKQAPMTRHRRGGYGYGGNF